MTHGVGREAERSGHFRAPLACLASLAVSDAAASTLAALARIAGQRVEVNIATRLLAGRRSGGKSPCGCKNRAEQDRDP